MTSRRSERCSATSGSTRRRSTRRSGRRNSSARLASTTRKRGGCSTLRRERCVVFEEVCALQREVLQTSSIKHQRNRLGGPNGIRTRVSALRGPCPGPLDDGASRICWLGEEDSNPRYVVQSHASYH